MKKTIKTEKVLAVWQVLGSAKYTKMEDADKIKVWKISRVLKPIATQFEDDSKSAAETMKPYETFTDDLTKAQEYERVKGVGCEMTAEEYKKFIADFKAYNELVSKAIKDFGDKEVELEFDALSEEAFGKLMASNEWTVEQVMELGTLIVE